MQDNSVFHTICEDTWELRFLTDEEYSKLVDKTSRGSTQVLERTISFNLKYFSKEVVIHELTHVYIANTFLDEASPKFKQAEEVFCELMAHKAEKILEHAEVVYKLGKCYL